MTDIRHILRLIMVVILTAPITWVLPTLAEYFQHYIEVSSGLYNSAKDFNAHQNDLMRLLAGILKATTVFLVSMLIVPRIVHGQLLSGSKALDVKAVNKAIQILGGCLVAIALGWLLYSVVTHFTQLGSLIIKTHVILIPFFILNFLYEKYLPRDLGILYSVKAGEV